MTHVPGHAAWPSPSAPRCAGERAAPRRASAQRRIPSAQVKKRLRTLKRGVVKRELKDATSKLGVRPAKVSEKLTEAASGYIRPPRKVKNAFRSEDPDAVIPQHEYRQGPDFRAGTLGADAGYALMGASRPKVGRRGGDAPSAYVDVPATSDEPEVSAAAAPTKPDAGVNRLLMGSNQLCPMFSSKRAKKRLKNKAGVRTHLPAPHQTDRVPSLCAAAQVDHNVFRWSS